jgi:hypothetical protein
MSYLNVVSCCRFSSEQLGLPEDEGLDTGQFSLDSTPGGQGTVLGQILSVDTVLDQVTAGTHFLVVGTIPLGEAPPLGHINLLSTGELELGTSQGLNNGILVLVVASDREKDLSNTNTGNSSVSLTESTSHSSLEPISSGTGQHFIDSQNVEGVDTHSDVELILAAVLDKVLVAANTSGLHSLGGKLLQLVGDKMDGQRELIDAGLLSAQVEDTDLGIGDTTVKP